MRRRRRRRIAIFVRGANGERRIGKHGWMHEELARKKDRVHLPGKLGAAIVGADRSEAYDATTTTNH